jgi:hypothetical protein
MYFDALLLQSRCGKDEMTMNLESLANELLLDLFEYFSTFHLLRAFHDLNSRFDTLLCVQFRAYHLDFRSMSKHDFQIICQQYLPSLIDRIISLRLRDGDDDSPQQTNLFFSHGLMLRQFTNIRSLSLCHICSEETMSKMMVECEHLPALSHFKLIKCDSSFKHINVVQVFNALRSLPKLTHCHLDI